MNLMADTMVSPTSYMRAYFRRRGWRLPTDTRVIPNVMPSSQAQAAAPHLQDVRSASQSPLAAWHTLSQGIGFMWLAVSIQHELRRNGVGNTVSAMHAREMASCELACLLDAGGCGGWRSSRAWRSARASSCLWTPCTGWTMPRLHSTR